MLNCVCGRLLSFGLMHRSYLTEEMIKGLTEKRLLKRSVGIVAESCYHNMLWRKRAENVVHKLSIYLFFPNIR